MHERTTERGELSRDTKSIRLYGETYKLVENKSALVTKKKLHKALWAVTRVIVFYIYGKDCYTCNARNLEGQNLQCGHFITDATCDMKISYDLRNLRAQCRRCNIFLSGNWQEYENRLIATHGEKYVSDLKAENMQRKGKYNYHDTWFYDQIIHRYKWIEEHIPEAVL